MDTSCWCKRWVGEIFRRELSGAADAKVADRLRDFTAERPLGTYTEEIEDRLMLLDGVFCRLDAMEFEVRKGEPVTREYVIDGTTNTTSTCGTNWPVRLKYPALFN